MAKLLDLIERLPLPNRPVTLQINRELSRGAWGVVHSGLWDKQPVAVKAIHAMLKDADKGENVVLNFCKECDRLKDMQHPHVIEFLGAFKDPTHGPILVMEEMKEHLQTFLERCKDNLALHDQLHISLQITRGVAFLHQLNPPMVHRDLNDKNVMFSFEGVAKIGDFGQSKLKQDLFLSTRVPGMVSFMPPEALQEDNCKYDESLDVFSLGVLMLEIGTQQPPSGNIVGIGIMREVKRREKDLRRMSILHPLQPFILLCLNDDPQLRPKATELQTVLMNLDETQQELKRRQQEFEGKQQELDKTKQELNGAKQELEGMNQELEGKNQELDGTKQELKGTKQELKEMKQELDGAKQELKEMKQELDGAKQELKEMKQELNGMKQELEGTKQELKGMKQELNGTKHELDKTKQELDRTKQELEGTKLELKGTKQELEGTKLELQRVKQELQGTRWELEGTKQELEETKQELEGTKQELERAKKELQGTQRELGGTEQELEGTRQELEGTQHELEGTKQEFKEAKQEHEQAKQEFKGTKQELEGAHQERKVILSSTFAGEHGVESGTPVDAKPISGHAVTERKDSSSRYIVAIDIGSTATRVAIATSKQPKNVYIYNRWPKAAGKTQVPTAVLYKQGEMAQLIAFGQEAVDDEEGPLFMNFQAHLYRQNFAKNTKLSSVGGEMRLPALKIFGDILKYIVLQVKENLMKTDKDLVVEKDIKWVLTVPDVQRDTASLFMTQAAGDVLREPAHHFMSGTAEQAHQLALVSTAEAAFSHISWLQHVDERMVKARKCMVITTGAESIGISTTQDKEHTISPQSACGASVINNGFQQFLCSLDVPGYPGFFEEAFENEHALNKLLQNFEASKAKFDGRNVMSVDLPIDIVRLYEQRQSEALSNALTQAINPKAYMLKDSTRLCVSQDKCLEWYEPTISSTVEIVQSLHGEHDVEALFIVGALANCKILSHRLRERFPDLPFVTPDRPGLVIIQGALRHCMQLSS